ncbi:Uncharacterised protein [Mycobacteroides abscessus subsp. abscessus]|uniref:Uncharacterized protein n=2 Tax=Mycobacteriaceae TaxID=1762 RepID=A0A7V8RUN2_9MYCO|nr:hypothetical protein ABG82_09685 [Mycobacteroides immunogenum]SID66985.1 Uncharacterised protein [Mycobacteroides abscessus subsp. abscessus]ANO06858.1 hypothetical protein BAB75_09740 [Mycobacteroides immunogenum]KIU38537.1 hypothetical protein TL11_21925 [Mycobacteroides immunogenum]KPG04329.1 hypothetical protein AN909_23820 [Mycobacteroides immunogenum]
MALAELFDEPQHVHGPDAQCCSAAEHPEAWAELTVGWSRVLGAARTLQERHAEDTHDAVLVMCADAAREAAVGELRWCWARLVNQYVEAVSTDV